MAVDLDNEGAVHQQYAVRAKNAFVPRQAALAEDCKVVVTGSDHGRAYVFDYANAAILADLVQPRKGFTQSIAVGESQIRPRCWLTLGSQAGNASDGTSTIVIASSSRYQAMSNDMERERMSICVWKRDVARAQCQNTSTVKTYRSRCRLIWRLVQSLATWVGLFAMLAMLVRWRATEAQLQQVSKCTTQSRPRCDYLRDRLLKLWIRWLQELRRCIGVQAVKYIDPYSYKCPPSMKSRFSCHADSNVWRTS
jgi:hypothetical protein